MALFSKKQQNTPNRRRMDAQSNEHPVVRVGEEGSTFRRNRTLTGSVSSKVLSANESKANLKSARVQTHDLTRRRRHIGAMLALVIFGAGIIYVLISQLTAGVVVKAQDVSMRLDPIYEKTIQDYLSRQPIERLRFMLNIANLSEYLQINTPEIASIRSDGSAGFGKSAFIVTMRSPIAGWNVGGRQQYVDTTGTSFGRNYFAAPVVQIVDKSGVRVANGQAVASNRFLSFVGRVVGQAKMRGYIVAQVIIPTTTTRQVEIQLQGITYPVKLSVDREVGEQVEDMDRSVKWMRGHNVTPQYIDVRVSGRAFYK